MSGIFISYRREDSQGEALHLFHDLKESFGADHVFMDIAGIDPGKDFRKVIEGAVGACDVLIAVIGKRWLGEVDEAGKRRLDDPKDFVRLETVAALRRDVAVIPVLVQQVGMPRSDQLPAELEALAWRNAFELRHNRWDSDVAELFKTLKKILPADVTLAAAPSTNFQNPEAGKRSGVQESYRPLSLSRNLIALFAVILVMAMSFLVIWPNNPVTKATSAHLGRVWTMEESGWQGVWRRRGNTDEFDATWTIPGTTDKIISSVTVTVENDKVDAARKDISRNGGQSGLNVCNYLGLLKSSKKTVEGRGICTGASFAEVPWSVTIK